jgi:hypothetical protein
MKPRKSFRRLLAIVAEFQSVAKGNIASKEGKCASGGEIVGYAGEGLFVRPSFPAWPKRPLIVRPGWKAWPHDQLGFCEINASGKITICRLPR